MLERHTSFPKKKKNNLNFHFKTFPHMYDFANKFVSITRLLCILYTLHPVLPLFVQIKVTRVILLMRKRNAVLTGAK